MRCIKCKELFGNMLDDGIPVNSILGQLCGTCWGNLSSTKEKMKKLSKYVSSGSATCKRGEEI